MLNEYKFYYDESEHSRAINKKTIESINYCDSFITAIVGWKSADEERVEDRYRLFENKYSARKSNGELKSTTIKKKQLQKGFVSLSRDNIQFIEDFVDLFDEKILLCFSVNSKIEYIINQLFVDYKSDFYINMDLMKFSITKSIETYLPKEVINGMYENTGEFTRLLREFYIRKIKENEANIKLKERENNAFYQIIPLLDNVKKDIVLNWNYDTAFHGFKKYIKEKNIMNYYLFLDKEGTDKKESNTLKSAKELGLSNVYELNSKESIGVRMADMLVGIVSKLLKSLKHELREEFPREALKKKILSKEWFELNEQQFILYKRLYFIISRLNNAYYKTFGGLYLDDFILLISFLEFINSFNSVSEVYKERDQIREHFNSHLCRKIEWHLKRIEENIIS